MSAANASQRGGLRVVDVSLEDPTDETRRLRDAEDGRRLLADAYFVAEADKAWERTASASEARTNDANPCVTVLVRASTSRLIVSR